MALSCAAVDDACAWVLLATVVATTRECLLSRLWPSEGNFGRPAVHRRQSAARCSPGWK